jgi:hypothetical protein
MNTAHFNTSMRGALRDAGIAAMQYRNIASALMSRSAWCFDTTLR